FPDGNVDEAKAAVRSGDDSNVGADDRDRCVGEWRETRIGDHTIDLSGGSARSRLRREVVPDECRTECESKRDARHGHDEPSRSRLGRSRGRGSIASPDQNEPAPGAIGRLVLQRYLRGSSEELDAGDLFWRRQLAIVQLLSEAIDDGHDRTILRLPR